MVMGRDCRVIHTGLYQALSEMEALGVAVSTIRTKHSSFHSLDMNSISIDRKYNLINL